MSGMEVMKKNSAYSCLDKKPTRVLNRPRVNQFTFIDGPKTEPCRIPYSKVQFFYEINQISASSLTPASLFSLSSNKTLLLNTCKSRK